MSIKHKIEKCRIKYYKREFCFFGGNMNSNIVLLGLLYLLYAEGYINLTQVLLLLALSASTVCSCRNTNNTNGSFNTMNSTT